VLVVTAMLAVALPARSQSPPPLSVAFLYDFTSSVSTLLYVSAGVGDNPVLEQFTNAIVAELGTADSLRFGLMTYRLDLSRPYAKHELQDFYHAVVQQTAVKTTDRAGPSPIWDAMDTATSALASAPGRRAILVVTDGQSTGNVHGVADVIAHAQAAHVALYPIFVGDRRLLSPAWAVHPGDTLAALAHATGGTYTVIKEVRVSTDVQVSDAKKGKTPEGKTPEGISGYIPDPASTTTITGPVAKIFELLRR
jgi:hypothetical protein